MRITENPFLNALGFELVRMEEGTSEITVTLQPQHVNSWQVMHGGVIMTLLDASMSRAARSLVEGVTSAATVEMKTSFFQPGGKAGSCMRGTGQVLHCSTTLFYCEGEVRNGDALVAKAMGTFKVFKRSDIARRLKV